MSLSLFILNWTFWGGGRVTPFSSLFTYRSGIKPSIQPTNAGEDGGGGLFVEIEGVSAQESADPTILRSRLVEVQLDMLPGTNRAVEAQSTSDTLPLNLFDDVSVSATLDHLEYSLPGMVTWVGSVDGYEGSLAILVAGDDGVVSGNVSFDDQIFQVRYVSPGVHAIYQIDQSQFPDDPGIEPPVPDLSDSALEPQESLLISAQDDGSIIDVMLLYTDDARAGAGGTSAIQSLVNLAVSETNQIYANSSITQRIRLVYTGEVAYNETGDLSEDLYALTDPSDGVIDSSYTLRNAYGADLVSLIVENGGAYCGMGWMMTSVASWFEEYGYTVVDRSCATGYYSVAHEMGHNMGAHHDWYVNSSTAPYVYNHGYINLTARFRTVMSYNNQCSDNSVYCTRIPNFSNPSVYYSGYATGVAGTTYGTAADNHRVLNNTAYTVANFRQSVYGLSAPTNLAASVVQSPSLAVNLTWSDTNSTESGFIVERRLSGGTFAQIGTTGANVLSYQDTGITCGNTSYQYRVFAYNSGSTSDASNAVTIVTPLCAPGNFAATAVSQKRIRLTWSDTNSTETGYRVERSANGTSGWTQLGSNLSADVFTYDDTGLTCGTTYYYRVAVFNASYTTYTSVVNRSPNACGVPPAPTGVSPRPVSTTTIEVIWTDVLDDETSYFVERSANGLTGWTQICTTGENVTQCYDYRLASDSSYYYRVAACNSYPDPSYSNKASTRTYKYGLYAPLTSHP